MVKDFYLRFLYTCCKDPFREAIFRVILSFRCFCITKECISLYPRGLWYSFPDCSLMWISYLSETSKMDSAISNYPKVHPFCKKAQYFSLWWKYMCMLCFLKQEFLREAVKEFSSWWNLSLPVGSIKWQNFEEPDNFTLPPKSWEKCISSPYGKKGDLPRSFHKQNTGRVKPVNKQKLPQTK